MAGLEGQRVLVTGADSTARVVAETFTASGARVFACDIREEAIQALATDNTGVKGIVADVGDEDPEVVSSSGGEVGTPAYIVSEQNRNERTTEASDWFAVGVLLYQALTGELPFKGDNLASLAQQIMNKKHRSIREIRPELPVRVVRIINKALQKKADKRYASAQEMADALARA